MASQRTITGSSLLAGVPSAAGDALFTAMNPRTGEHGEEFADATAEEIQRAVGAAAAASRELAEWSMEEVSSLLEACADSLEEVGEALVATADEETALGRSPRLEGELARTTGQWRAFARMVRAGWHLEAIIDHATASHPDIRRVLQPVGPVAVFGASNFPLAFSVPGGDTASALAAGCPVVVKGHPSHPATSEMAARALTAAMESEGAPPGAFSMVQGSGPEVGRRLVLADQIRAVGFTGSFGAGRSIHDLASTRSRPIPVYAEMGSLNPVFITPGAMAERCDEIAEGLASSMTLGIGQFCTKPGLVFLPPESADLFEQRLISELEKVDASPLLNPAIASSFLEQVDESSALAEVDLRLSPSFGGEGALACTPGLLRASLDAYLNQDHLTEEHFGPVAVLVITPTDRFAEAASNIAGSLTGTIHALESEQSEYSDLVAELSRRVGRLIWNGFPTGVAVVPSMHHGGPYPATTNSQHTSVGMTAVRRFLRPIAFQNAPQQSLPAALRNDNPWGLRRLVDWEWE